jgi:Mn-dependent DtxR family transcriptional regulator
MTRPRDISNRTLLDRIYRAIAVSPSGYPSTTAIARSIEMKSELVREYLREFAAQGKVRYDAEREGWVRA